MKADRARVDEKDEASQDSDIHRKFDNSIRKEKIDELSRRLHEEGVKKVKTRIEMAESKDKLVMDNCTFKPTVNKMTSRQQYARQNRFGKTFNETKMPFEVMQKRAQTADAKKVAEIQSKPVVKSKLPPTIGM